MALTPGSASGSQERLGDGAKDVRRRPVGFADDDRDPPVPALADRRDEGNLAQEHGAQALGGGDAPARAEERVLLRRRDRRSGSCSRPPRAAARSPSGTSGRPCSATLVAAGCGVVTMTAPSSGSVWTRESWASPVPGGRSTSRTSSSPHFTFCTNCWTVFITMGPRQMTGVFVVDEKAHAHHLDPVLLHRDQDGVRALALDLGPSVQPDHQRHARPVDVTYPSGRPGPAGRGRSAPGRGRRPG